MTPSKLPELEDVSIARLLVRKEKLERVFDFYLNTDMEARHINELVSELLQVLPDKITTETVFESVKHLMGVRLTAQLGKAEAWRLAGNIRRLLSAKPARPWVRQSVMEWAPVQIVDYQFRKTPRGKIGGIFYCRVLAGAPAGLLTEKFWLSRFCRSLAGHMGFTPPWGKYPFSNMEQFVGCRVYALFEPGERMRGMPYFDQIRGTAAVHTHNRRLLQMRKRVAFECPENFKHECHKCPIGYESCPAATHPKTFEKHFCRRCQQTTWFDPRFVALGLCVVCSRYD